MIFCSLCRSLVIKDSCTNKKCSGHVLRDEDITYSQMNYIERLRHQLGNKDDASFKGMTKAEASRIIANLKDIIENGGEEEW